MSADSKTIRLVTALVECRPDGEYVPWGIKWYDGAVYPFKEIESYTPRSWARAAGASTFMPRSWKRLAYRAMPRRLAWARASTSSSRSSSAFLLDKSSAFVAQR